MFEALRKAILPIIVIVLVVFMGMIVLQWGLDLSGRDQAQATNSAGIINGEEISWQTFSRTYTNLLQNEKASRGEDYQVPEDRARQLEDEAWNQLVTDRLIKQAAAEINIVVTDEDVYQYLRNSPPAFIQQIPELQTNGQFDYQKYMALMTDPQAAGLWAQVEPVVREDLKRIKVQQHIMLTAHVTEEEVRQAFIDNREKITVGVVNAPWASFYSTVPEPPDSVLQLFFDEHQEDYPIGERAVMEIVKVIKEASDFDKEEAKARIQMIYDSVTTGSDFVEFAQIYSDDPGSGANGGDLGWFAPGRMVKEFDSAAFAMREGEISVPIETSFGWHILKHQGYRTQDTVREAHVSHILVKPVASERTLDAGWEKLESIRQFSGDLGFDSAATNVEATVFTTKPIERNGYVSYIGSGAPVLEWAFAAEVGDISEVMDLPNVYCVVRLAERLPEGIAAFDDVKPRLVRDYRNAKLATICKDTISLVYDEIGRGATLEAAAQKYAMTYEKLSPFSRDGSVAKVASDQTVIGTAFGLPEVGAVSRPINYSTGSVVLELLERVSPDLSEYNAQRDSVYTALLNSKQQQVFGNWFTQLSDAAEIQSNFTSRRR